MVHKIFLGLGSNVGDKKSNIKKAIKFLEEKVDNIIVAPIYETKPWGYKNQDNFFNTALRGETSLLPFQLLNFIKEVEKKVGRKKRFRYGPREIDIDILFYDNLFLKNKRIEIPHPQLHKRDFVLKPLLDLETDFIHPVFKKTIQELYKTLSQEERTIIEDKFSV